MVVALVLSACGQAGGEQGDHVVMAEAETPAPATATAAPAERPVPGEPPPSSSPPSAPAAPAEPGPPRAEHAAALPRDCPPHEQPPPGQPPDDVVQRALRYVEQHPDTSGGLWIWGEGMRFRFTRDHAAHLAELERIAEGRMTVEVLPARWSERELRALQERVSHHGGDYAGARMSAVGVDVFANQVMVMLDRVDDASRAAVAERWLAEQVCMAEGTVEARPGEPEPATRTIPLP